MMSIEWGQGFEERKVWKYRREGLSGFTEYSGQQVLKNPIRNEIVLRFWKKTVE